MQQVVEVLEEYHRQDNAPKDHFLEHFQAKVEKVKVDMSASPNEWERAWYVQLLNRRRARRFHMLILVLCSKEQNDKFIGALATELNSMLAVPVLPEQATGKAGQSQSKTRRRSHTAGFEGEQQYDELNEDYSTHPLYLASSACLNLSLSTVETYKAAAMLVDSAKPQLPVLGEGWQEEMDTLVGILETGKRVTERQVSKMTLKGIESSAVHNDAEMKEIANVENLLGMQIHGRFDNPYVSGQAVDWATSVKAAEKGAKALARGLAAHEQ